MTTDSPYFFSNPASGGPAFPCPEISTRHFGDPGVYPGMTLRDWIATHAMQAAATNPTGAEGFTFDERAEWAYQQADAMLKARQQ